MKSPVSIPRPRRADRTLLPAALLALLAALLAVQWLLPSAVELPDAPAVRPLRLPPLSVTVRGADPVIAQRPLFAPGRREVASAGTADKSAPLEGARAVGLIATRGGGARLFVQAPDGSLSRVAPGGSYRGWRLVRITPNAALFVRGAETATLAITASAPPVAAPPADGEEPEEEPQ